MILWAVSENRISEVREILQLDADTVNAKDNDGYTPLHRACYNNFLDIARLLLQYQANPNARTELAGPHYTQPANGVMLIVYSCCCNSALM